MRVLGWLLLVGLSGCGVEREGASVAASAKASGAPPGASAAATQNPFGAATGAAEKAADDAQTRAPHQASKQGASDGSREEGATDGARRRGLDGGLDKPSILAAVASPLKGEVADADIRAAVDAKAGAMSRCLNADTVVESSLKIMPSGDITEVSITKIHPDEPIVRDCVASILRSARVQNVRGGEPTAVTIKLVLKKGGI